MTCSSHKHVMDSYMKLIHAQTRQAFPQSISKRRGLEMSFHITYFSLEKKVLSTILLIAPIKDFQKDLGSIS